MNQRNVKIRIHNAITLDEETNEHLTEVSGNLIQRGETHFLRYRDEELQSNVLVKWIEGIQELWVQRQGEMDVRQHFVPNVETYAIYKTRHGDFSLQTHTEHLEWSNKSITISFTTRLGVGPYVNNRLVISYAD